MRRLLPFAVAVLAGCASTAPDEPAAGTTTPKPAETAAPKPPPPPTVDVKGNPNRVYQLDTLKKTDLSVKGSPIHAWIMDTEGKQQEGMMFLKDEDVKADEGMLFAFSEPQTKMRASGEPSGFWMENTLIPLDIIYMSPKGQVVNIAHGKVKDETTLPAEGDYQYVLEVKTGTAARIGLKAGDTVAIPKL